MGMVLFDPPVEIQKITSLIVQDPFDVERNCTGGVDTETIILEFERAVKLMDTGDITKVFETGIPLHERTWNDFA
jgi:hypothetical protein